MPLMVMLACYHPIWPTGDRSLYREGETAYCATCRARREITSVGDTQW